jgi:hypothetical protein
VDYANKGGWKPLVLNTSEITASPHRDVVHLRHTGKYIQDMMRATSNNTWDLIEHTRLLGLVNCCWPSSAQSLLVASHGCQDSTRFLTISRSRLTTQQTTSLLKIAWLVDRTQPSPRQICTATSKWIAHLEGKCCLPLHFITSHNTQSNCARNSPSCTYERSAL